MHINNTTSAAELPEILIQAADTLHHLSGLSVCITDAVTPVHIIGEKMVQPWLATLEDSLLRSIAQLNAQKQPPSAALESAVFTLDRMMSFIYIPVQLPYALLLGPYHLQSELSLNALVKAAYALVGQPVVQAVHSIRFGEATKHTEPAPVPLSDLTSKHQARPLIPYVQEVENPNIALMIRDFVVLGNAAKAIDLFKKSTAHIAKPLSSRDVHDKNEAAHRIGLLYSIFYKMVECSVDHKGLIQIKDKYLEQYHRSRCTQEMDLITQDMLTHFSTHAQLNQRIESYTELIQKAIVYIYENAKRKISLKDVATGLHVNACYLSSIFKKETGKSLTLFITEIKMEEAKRLLLNTAFPITTICYEIGFDNPSYFTEVFKKIVGVTPKEFKNNG